MNADLLLHTVEDETTVSEEQTVQIDFSTLTCETARQPPC